MQDRIERAARIRTEGTEVLVEWLREAEPHLPEWFADQMRSTDTEMFALELEAWASWEGPWEELAHIRAPTLLVTGELEEGEGGVAAVNARAAASALPKGRSVVLPGLGHCMAFIRSDLVLPHVTAFLDEVAARRAV